MVGNKFCTAIVPAAGNASRMKGIDKLLAELAGMPIVIRTLKALDSCNLIDEIVVVTRQDLIENIENLSEYYGIEKLKKVIKGGADRAESVYLGLQAVSNNTEIVAIHDGARPFVSHELLDEVLNGVLITGAAAPAIPVTDTIKVAKNNIIQSTPDRSILYAVQTPQVFEYNLIKNALTKARHDNVILTDDCSAVEYIGKDVLLTNGSYENRKITTPIDIAIGEAILKCQNAI